MLPKRLKKSPIIDAVFDIRINTEKSLAISIPGLILQKYPDAKVSRSPAYGIPDQVLAENPNLRYLAVLRIEIGDGTVFLCGEKMFAVGYSSPYPGWEEFSLRIREALKILSTVERDQAVERIAIKYVDFVDKTVCDEIRTFSTFKVSLNNQDITDKDFAFKVASKQDKVSYVLQLTSNAKTLDRTGFVIDTDTILDFVDFYGKIVKVGDLVADFSGIEYLHKEAKSVFFSVVSEAGLKLLEAEYDEQ